MIASKFDLLTLFWRWWSTNTACSSHIHWKNGGILENFVNLQTHVKKVFSNQKKVNFIKHLLISMMIMCRWTSKQYSILSALSHQAIFDSFGCSLWFLLFSMDRRFTCHWNSLQVRSISHSGSGCQSLDWENSPRWSTGQFTWLDHYLHSLCIREFFLGSL